MCRWNHEIRRTHPQIRKTKAIQTKNSLNHGNSTLYTDSFCNISTLLQISMSFIWDKVP